MTSTIITKNSSTASGVPLAADLTAGELAINLADKRLFSKNGSTVFEVGTTPSTVAVTGNATVGGTLGVTGATTLAATSATTLSASSTVTLSGGTANGVAYLNGSKVLTSGSALTFDGNVLSTQKSSSGDAFKWASATGKTAYAYADGSGIGLFTGATVTGTGFYANDTSSYFATYTGGSEQMRLTSTGLGIGTSAPAQKLDVNTAVVGISTPVRISNSSATTNGRGTGLEFFGASNTFGRIEGFWAGADEQVRLFSTGSMTFSSGGTTERMRLDSAGNLGLGVTPSAWLSNRRALEIGGQAAAVLALNGTAAVSEIYGNAFRNSAGTYIYAQTGPASYVNFNNQSGGGWAWSIAPSGTAGNAITFTQAMTLDASGNLLVGKTSAGAGNVGYQIDQTGISYLSNSATTDATTTNHIYSTGASAFRFYVGLGGTVFATSIVISAISDQRLKENVRDIDTGLDAIMALKPRRFDWKEGKGQDKKNVAGFIAQEFETVFPECVGVTKAGEDGVEYKNINHETLIPTLVKAIQEQQAEIQSLRKRLAAAGI